METADTVTDGDSLEVHTCDQTQGDGVPATTLPQYISGEELLNEGDGADEEKLLAPVMTPRTHLGRYALKGLLGRGGIGAVYRAQDPELGREVALKVLLAGAHADSTQHRRFLREARAIARLDHPGIVKVYDFGVADGEAFFTMQLVNGPTLHGLLLRRGALEPHEAARITLELARTLDYAHNAGLIHRDVKPHNVIMEDGVRPLLTDFGLVKRLTDGESAHLTQAGQIMGTPHYMAPEQATGLSKEVTPAIDQYALGAMLYEMLSGQRPFATLPAFRVLAEAQQGEPTPLSVLAPATPPALQVICARAMSKRPTDRFKDMGKMADALRAFLDGESVVTRASIIKRRTRSWLRRHRSHLIRIAALLLTAALTFALNNAWQQHLADQRQADREVNAEARRIGMERRVIQLDRSSQTDKADRLFGSFIEFKDNHNTRALARAWLFQDQRMKARDDAARSKEAIASAYAQAHHPEEQVEALQRLAAYVHQHGDWHGLRAVLKTLHTRHPDAVVPRPITRDMALFDRDYNTALAHSPDQAPLMETIARGTPTHWRAQAAAPWDIDQDGRDELMLWSHHDPHLQIMALEPGPTLTKVKTLIRPKDWHWGFPISAPRPMLVYSRQERQGSALVTVEGDTLTPTTQWTDPWVWSQPRQVDLDGDGAVETYMNAERSFLRLEQDVNGAWVRTAPHVPTNQTNSEPRKIDVADIDGDGKPELIVGLSDWGAYDVRVFKPSTTPGGQLRMVSRFKLGRIELLATFRGPNGQMQIVAYQALDTYLNRRVFDPEHAPMASRGLHMLAWGQEGLEYLDASPGHLPLAIADHESGLDRVNAMPPGHVFEFLEGADLDGDGLDEIVFSRHPKHTHILHQKPNGSFEPLPMPGVYPLAVVQADEDPADELLVTAPHHNFQVWIMGAGDTPLRPLERPGEIQADVPPAIDPALQQSWERTEDLARAGLLDVAAQRLEQIAQRSVGTPTEPLALYRAGQLLERAEQFERAGFHYEAAARRSRRVPDALEAARRSYQSAHLFERELNVIHALTTPELNARAERLQRAISTQTTTFTFDKGIDPRWRILHPSGARIDPRRSALHLQSVAGHPTLELPLTPQRATTISIEIDVEAKRLDWGSMWSVALGPVTSMGYDYWLRASGRGGGEAIFEEFNCGYFRFSPTNTNHHGELLHKRLTLRLEFDTEEQWGVCTIRHGDRVLARQIRTMPRPLPDSATVLRISTDDMAVSELLLHRLSLTGVTPDNTPVTDPLLLAHRELTMGRPDQALQQLARLPDSPSVRVGRAFALEELRRHDDSLALFTALLDDDSLAQFRRHFILTQPARFEALMRPQWGVRYFPAFFDAWNVTLVMHPNDDFVTEVLTQHLSGLLELPLDTFTAPQDR
ncbi:MAG: protein kinase, partial [Myxococcota bacterium]